jgi:hypothetical protein
MTQMTDKIPWAKLKQSECPHKPEWQMYRQLNQKVDDPFKITVADLCGGINPYVWRIEYCGGCGKTTRTYGEVPEEVK